MIQLKYILTFAALLAYVGAESPPAGSPGDKCSSDNDCNDTLICFSYGKTCQKLRAKGEQCGGMTLPGCDLGLECIYPPAGKCLRKSDSIQKRSKKGVGRKKCKNGDGAESKEGQPCDFDAECGHGFECGDFVRDKYPGTCKPAVPRD